MPCGRVLSLAFFSRKFTFPEKKFARPQAAASPALHSSFKLPGRASLTSALPGGPNPREQSAGQPSRGAARTIYSRISKCGERKLESARGRSLTRRSTHVRCLARGKVSAHSVWGVHAPPMPGQGQGQRANPLTVKVRPGVKKRWRTPARTRRRHDARKPGVWATEGVPRSA